jgi:hypothetical protein
MLSIAPLAVTTLAKAVLAIMNARMVINIFLDFMFDP